MSTTRRAVKAAWISTPSMSRGSRPRMRASVIWQRQSRVSARRPSLVHCCSRSSTSARSAPVAAPVAASTTGRLRFGKGSIRSNWISTGRCRVVCRIHRCNETTIGSGTSPTNRSVICQLAGFVRRRHAFDFYDSVSRRYCVLLLIAARTVASGIEAKNTHLPILWQSRDAWWWAMPHSCQAARGQHQLRGGFNRFNRSSTRADQLCNLLPGECQSRDIGRDVLGRKRPKSQPRGSRCCSSQRSRGARRTERPAVARGAPMACSVVRMGYLSLESAQWNLPQLPSGCCRSANWLTRSHQRSAVSWLARSLSGSWSTSLSIRIATGGLSLGRVRVQAIDLVRPSV